MLGTGIIKGMAETARNFLGSYVSAERLTTVQYPEERLAPKEAARNFPFLVFDGDDAMLGLRCVAHAGEEGPPAYIESALDVLLVERIDHGVRCVESQALVQRLAAMRMPLTVCPFSNVKLRVFDSLADHNLPALLDAGLCACVNSDDPAYFGGYLNDNLVQTFAALPQLGPQHAYQLLRNSFEASFCSDAQRADWIAELDAAFVMAAG